MLLWLDTAAGDAPGTETARLSPVCPSSTHTQSASKPRSRMPPRGVPRGPAWAQRWACLLLRQLRMLPHQNQHLQLLQQQHQRAKRCLLTPSHPAGNELFSRVLLVVLVIVHGASLPLVWVWNARQQLEDAGVCLVGLGAAGVGGAICQYDRGAAASLGCTGMTSTQLLTLLSVFFRLCS